MVIVKIWGGLGNQMFQYATAKAVALKYGVDLKLDISHYDKQNENETAREFRLNIFPSINAEIASAAEVKKCKTIFSNALFNSIYRNVNKHFPRLNSNYLIERKKGYEAISINAATNTYLEGYWQSEEYFKTDRVQIINQFNLDHLQHINSLALKVNEITCTNAVSVHVRRGDYVSNSQANAYHGVCSLEYYESAIKMLIGKLVDPIKFYVFSDDISWCKENLRFTSEHEYVSTTEDFHDLYLMSKCKHNIIANSSFSWWAAWLNRDDKKIVVAPKTWFADEESNNIVPGAWLKV